MVGILDAQGGRQFDQASYKGPYYNARKVRQMRQNGCTASTPSPPPPLPPTIFNQQVRESPQPKTDPTLILQAQQELVHDSFTNVSLSS